MTSEEILNGFNNLIKNNSNIIREQSQGKTPIKAQFISTNRSVNKRKRLTMVFGEHSRELIASDLAIFLANSWIKDYIKKDKSSKESLLHKFDVMLVPIVNPLSRKKVEEGQYCLRTNPNGIDLNRNYNAHFRQKCIGQGKSKECTGPIAFSEDETQAVKEAIESFRPEVFMSVHSGSHSILVPYAYSFKHKMNHKLRKTENMDKQLDHIESVAVHTNRKQCDCECGRAAEVLQQECPGNGMDWAYDVMRSKWAFAFEIQGTLGTMGRNRFNQDVSKWKKGNFNKSMYQEIKDWQNFHPRGKTIEKSHKNDSEISFLQIHPRKEQERPNKILELVQKNSHFTKDNELNKIKTNRNKSFYENQIHHKFTEQDDCQSSFNPDTLPRQEQTLTNWKRITEAILGEIYND